ncbi:MULTISPECIES: UDP-N-acetylmuramate--L-alanine ligase [Leptolyngbya]|jgi:UDP-N-acetylmuramate--alanine ligase|uniref:UDP-N-acetylmuramate--L-alanine ligase n=2 Tax=Leptolyngbya boryana TaxID=1184 RepID=A0A1Z4JAD0_LEPBY|nr:MULTISPECIES: UDP-N-acetylmuramate--L-alanine ligase [Leptolyngbya]BAY53716.1 UDP-N-acetylmuramate--L-alanine ligase [Leptolyngbya boryana NIES-2135]MBD1858159.1 UDP-N-acetylmuramate--L-alanine ligase [Leptolyngbya sp. FACHB-1624]MBD2367842.1 UDP-N-acetylmuramate--L-alanine ligase [Leptolyngbya sp. FACHB-161]MBD2374310.1 UDP-N-acetylmuramate--L-alanine ligase [Leptolyngbya sp. FACHB-238]MBD2398532.1 UDP-N-acetylmuramate--L-alanine ligase [Leptolyngbya sp. FACHB-239]
MLSSVDFSGRPFHFIGIGGIGMSALAYVLLDRGLPVSGSDLRSSHITERLRSLGAQIFIGQDASNLDHYQVRAQLAQPVAAGANVVTLPAPVKDLPQVICSTAINPTNSEYRAALELGCPIFHRSDLLAALIREYRSIAVAGTHGKTTTSSMISYMLYNAKLDPTVIVGGEVKAWQGNARIGRGEYMVAEADESDGSLVKFAPYIGIITNAELDHPDHYSDLDQVVQTFQTFASQCQVTVGSIDCQTVRDRIPPNITYSLDPATKADYTVDQIQYAGDGTTARVWERGQVLGEIKLRVLGQHNLSNALAAIAVGRLIGLEFSTIAAAIAPFEGARRRFEHRGDFNDILFIDDYAHHPSELRVTLEAARLQAGKQSPRRRVVAIFQPHRYSRTQTFLAEFAESFGDADVVILSDIYSAGEVNTGEISGQILADLVATHHSCVHYQPSLPAMGDFLNKLLVPGDLAIFLGAGNLNQIIPDVMAAQQRVEKAAS